MWEETNQLMRNIVIDILVYSSTVKCYFIISGAHFIQNKAYLMKFISFEKRKQTGNDHLGLYKQRPWVKAVFFLGQISECALVKKEKSYLADPQKVSKWAATKPGSLDQWPPRLSLTCHLHLFAASVPVRCSVSYSPNPPFSE